jgi:hypothetical protein
LRQERLVTATATVKPQRIHKELIISKQGNGNQPNEEATERLLLQLLSKISRKKEEKKRRKKETESARILITITITASVFSAQFLCVKLQFFFEYSLPLAPSPHLYTLSLVL